MFEKVNPAHPDKIADRIAGAIVDLSYKKQDAPKVAVEVLIGHGDCTIINETSQSLSEDEVESIVARITEDDVIDIRYLERKQDAILAHNQEDVPRCGDNGVFKGSTISKEEQLLTNFAYEMYLDYKSDGKYIYNADDKSLIICQSKASTKNLKENFLSEMYPISAKSIDVSRLKINPLGAWSGGIYIDSGATNRKLGSDMGGAAFGGGLHGKDLSKADVSVNIYMHIKAELVKMIEKKEDREHCLGPVPLETYCAIGDLVLDKKPYFEVVNIAKAYIDDIGGFEKFAEWGLIRPKSLDVDYKKYAALVFGQAVAKFLK